MAEYARSVTGSPLDQKDSEELKKRIVDSIFVSYAARASDPVRIAKGTLLPATGPHESRIYFSGKQAPVDIATFINGCMTRYLDYNDTYLSKEALHPSDNVPPVLCSADSVGLNGAEALKALKVAYQVTCALSDAVSIRDRGWDHVTYISIASAAGLASLFDLEEGRFVHALNLGINNNVSLRQTRAGELSMWKGCTAANAARNSVFAVFLAKDGLTGPAPIFEGEMGFFRQVSGEFRLDLAADRVPQTMVKNYPVEYHAMSGVDAVLKLKEKMIGKIAQIEVETFTVAHKIIVKDPEKLRPKTKETADHSLPYILAYTFLHGAPGLDAYDERHLTDKRILGLIDKMNFQVSPRFDAMYPNLLPIKVSVTTSEGFFEEEVIVPKGHFKDPYTWEDLRRKGVSILKDSSLVDEVIHLGKDFDRRNVSELFEVISNVDP